MWFNLNLDGIVLKMRIKDYEPSTQEIWEDRWCSVDFSFKSKKWLDYYADNDEVFLPHEVEELAQALDDLLTDKLNEAVTIGCIEPDFHFVLIPKRDLRNDPKYCYIKEGHEIADIYMEMKISFWDDGLTANYLSINFDRSDIEYFRDYLFLVMGKLEKANPRIQEMLKKEILIERYAC